MAQTGYTPILIYSSSTASQAPVAGNLLNSTLGSELAINITDGKLFYKDNANAVQVIGWKTVPTTAGGTGLTSYTAGDLLYYASGTTLTKLGIGTAYYQLGVNAGGTAPAWQPSATSVLTAQGDLLYASAANTLARLAKSTTATRYLANTGTTNNPQWDQINLANGVTGTLPVANGGTGTATAFTAGSVVFAGASGVYSQNNSNLFWDNSNIRLGIGTASPSTTTEISGASAAFRVTGTSGTVPQVQLVSGGVVNWSLRVNQNTASDFTIYQDSVERFLFASGGDLTFKTGNLIQGTAAKGINFAANTGAAGVTSKLLNWYEEGTWTPTDGSGAGLSFSSTSNNCFYTRIGNVVTCIFNITYPTTSNTSPMRVSGLPFTSKSTASAVAGGYFSYQNTGVDLIILTESASTSFVVYIVSSAAVIQNVALSGKILRGVITYQV